MKYISLTYIKHNGRSYGPNDEIEIESKKDSDKLLNLKAVKLCPASSGNVPERYKEFNDKTNQQQIEYILELVNVEELNALEPYAKSKAKTVLKKRIQDIEAKKGADE